MWGRSVYDNIRKFLQFQLTVNVVALLVVFIGACGGFEPPLNAVMMLWINLVMDTLGALALATEAPKMTVLDRKPYKRQAALLSRPMIRNILVQSAFQLILLLVLLFAGANLFNVPEGEYCAEYDVSGDSTYRWDYGTNALNPYNNGTINCGTFRLICPDKDQDCYEQTHCDVYDDGDGNTTSCVNFHDLVDFKDKCLECKTIEWVHGTIIFNTFVFCQVFNEFNAKSITSDWDIYSDIFQNHIFLAVTALTVGLQIMLIEVGGAFIKTSPLNASQWLITIALALFTFPIGVLMRFIPVEEDPRDFFDNTPSDHQDNPTHSLLFPGSESLSGDVSLKQVKY